MTIWTKKKNILFLIMILVLAGNFQLVPAQGAESNVENKGYVLLDPSIISVAPNQKVGFLDYTQKIFVTIFIVTVLLAILMLVIGGFEYMFSEVPGIKSEAKETIKAAILGLLIALAAWLILNTINPDILSIDGTLFKALEKPSDGDR